MIEDKELAQLFKVESAEHLARLDDGLLRLEKTPTDPSLLEEMFRESHNMKGAARMLGLSKIESAAHSMETIMNTARKGEKTLTPDSIERMTVVLDDLRKLVQVALDGEPLVIKTADLLQDLSSGEIPVNGTSAMLAGATNQSNISEKDNFIVSAASSGHVPAEESIVSATEVKPISVAQNAMSVSISNELFDTTASVGKSLHIETVRIETRKLDELLTLVGELSVIEGRAQHRLSLVDALLEQWEQLERSRRKPMSVQGGAETGRRANEALAHFWSCLKDVRDTLFDDGVQLEAVVNTMEEQVHAARLLPLSTIFSLFPRMVRDLAQQQSKEVQLLLEGGEINVDKRILEEMKDPLMHLLRNAIDHGIETSLERNRHGKPDFGSVRLSATRENGRVLLEVADDGRGLDMDAIRQVALKRGLSTPAILESMPLSQLQQLIFLPGFSTSSFVTELSGRGVGLDVVRVNVEHLKGDIRMMSSPQGTIMQVRLPLSLATTRLLLVSVSGHVYGLPIDSVYSSLRVVDQDVFTLEGHPTINLDGQPVMSPCLSDLLSLRKENHGNETVCIVIQAGEERLGLRVDELLDEEEVVIKPLCSPLIRVRNVSGLSMLGSGLICAILNPADLLRSARQLSGVHIESKVELIEAVKPVILLVEDSALVRAMEQRILVEAGYEVVAAADGIDALDKLDQHLFSAVVSDIVMPNMDGLTLTSRIRQEPRYKYLPVILVTSLSSDEDKKRGLEVGANAYLPKPTFDQRVLLDTLRRLI